MKFWKTLRWFVAAIFLAIAFVGWLGTDPKVNHPPGAAESVRTVPNMVR
jgi:hypothetical protein